MKDIRYASTSLALDNRSKQSFDPLLLIQFKGAASSLPTPFSDKCEVVPDQNILVLSW